MSTFDTDGIAVARELIPARARKIIYAAASLASVALAAVVVGFTASTSPVPESVTIIMAVLGALMGPLGMLAASNVPATTALPEADAGIDELLAGEDTGL